MLIAGLILLVIAVGAFLFARSQRAKARAATATETLGCGDIEQLSQGVGAEVGAGSFRQRCEVVGAAAPGESGVTQAPHSGTDAVWHRSTVTHRYWEMERRETDGRTHWDRVEREETVSDITSAAPFVVSDATGQVAVSPEGADVDAPERVVDRFEQQTGGGAVAEGFLSGVLSAALRSGERTGSLGFRYEEWIIRPGARLYVHGEVADASGRLAFAKPTKGRFVISTRSEEEIVGEAERWAKWSAIGAGVAAVAGLGLVVAGALA
jgi:hypothetical protein